jgi:hypothetical protein
MLVALFFRMDGAITDEELRMMVRTYAVENIMEWKTH